MLCHCFKCRKNTQNKNPEVVKRKNNKKSKFLKEQEARGLLSNLLGVKLPILSDIPIVYTIFQKYKMSAIINKILLAGDKFIPELHLRQPGFTYSVGDPFTKNKERIKKFKETGDSRCIYQNELDKAYFQHGMTYGDFKDLNRRAGADKVLCDKAIVIKEVPVVVLKMKIFQTNNQLKNYTNQ